MFRRFFQRNKQSEAQEQHDDVHHMALRAGNQEPPEDPDEQAYANDQGEHADIAQKALQAGDYKRSIYHLGLALASNPTREEWLTLLEQWIAAVGPRALDLVPINDNQYFATLQASQKLMSIGNTATHRMEVMPVVAENYHAKVAIHAFILASQGQMKEAVDLLLQLLQVKPEIPYGFWLSRWKNQPGFFEALPSKQVASTALEIMKKYPGTYIFSESGRAEISYYLPLLKETYKALSSLEANENSFLTSFIYAMALRKTGSFEEAASVARTMAPSYHAQVALAMAEEALGNIDAAIAAYQLGLSMEPKDVAVRNDIGTLLLNQGQLTEAIALYKESAQLDPSDPYQLAISSIAYLNYLQTPSDKTSLKKLKSLAKHQHMAQRQLSFLETPYIGKLPFMGEALINLMRNFKAKSETKEIELKAGSTIEIGLSSLEAPSARLAAKLMLDARGVSFNLGIAEVLTPDPRQPLRPVEYQIWRYVEMEPIAAVPPPDTTVADSIAKLAQTPYALDLWHAPARALGQRLGVDALMSLLGVMVHPPTTPAGWDDWDWLIAVQIASALTLAYIDEGWEDSRRKAVLTSLIYGPMDWSGAAALIAMAVLARQNVRINIEFDRICCDLWRIGRGSPEWPLELAMIFGLLFVNAHSDEAKQQVNDYFARLQEEQKGENEK